MTTYGPYSDLIEEVLSVVERGVILGHPYHPVDDQISIHTRTLYSLIDIERFRDPDWPASQVQDGLCWVDIQRCDEGRFFSSDWSQEFRNVTQPALEVIERSVWNRLHEHLADILPIYEIEKIDGFIRNLLYLRGDCGHTSSFYEKLFTVYRSGGYPCGWSGCFPAGELIVFSHG